MVFPTDEQARLGVKLQKLGAPLIHQVIRHHEHGLLRQVQSAKFHGGRGHRPRFSRADDVRQQRTATLEDRFEERRTFTEVHVEFDGEGDSGQIHDVWAYRSGEGIELPETTLAIRGAVRGPPSRSPETNAGGYGEFRLDVADGAPCQRQN